MPSDDWEEERPKKKKLVEPLKMEGLSTKELHQLIAHFESEIARAKAELDTKVDLRDSAEALFKK